MIPPFIQQRTGPQLYVLVEEIRAVVERAEGPCGARFVSHQGPDSVCDLNYGHTGPHAWFGIALQSATTEDLRLAYLRVSDMPAERDAILRELRNREAGQYLHPQDPANPLGRP